MPGTRARDTEINKTKPESPQSVHSIRRRETDNKQTSKRIELSGRDRIEATEVILNFLAVILKK